MENNSLFISILVGFLPLLILAITGYLLKKNPPKTINKLYGYRTKRSKSSQQAWDFAQVYSAGLLLTWSIAGMVGLALQLSSTDNMNIMNLTITSTFVLILICGGVFYFTEKELKSKFK